jgi:RNA polymerase sigma factor for flagellar operon FliA
MRTNRPRTAPGELPDPPDVLRLIERGEPMVERMAKRIRGGLDPSYQLDDLIAAGKLGLLQAARRYDPSHGIAFEAFAYHRIQGEIYNEVGRFSDLKRTAYHRAVALEAATLSNGNDVFDGALQLASQDKVENMSEAEMEQAVDAVLGNVAAATAVGLLRPSLETEASDETHSDPLEQLERRQLAAIALNLLSELDPSDAEIFRRKHFEDLTYQDFSDELGLSRPWIYRRYNRVLGFLQERMAQLEAT